MFDTEAKIERDDWLDAVSKDASFIMDPYKVRNKLMEHVFGRASHKSQG